MTPSSPEAGLEKTAASSRGAGALPALQIGESFGRFVLLHQLGAGGMGVVWAAYDPQLDRNLALKFVRASSEGSSGQELRERLVREGKALAKVSHPNVIAVHDVVTTDDQVCVVEELVRGASLDAWLAETARPLDEILGFFVQAGRGLSAAHAAGLVHRDFKPSNVLVGDDGRARVADFGMARTVHEAPTIKPGSDTVRSPVGAGNLTQAGALVGTPRYMAPEQYLGEAADAQSDQFSFCVSLYEAVYGEHPFAGDTLAELAGEIIRGNVRPPKKGSRVPPWLRSAVLRGLRSVRAERYPNMDALLTALDPRPVRRRRALMLGGVALGVLALAGGGVARWRAVERRAACDPRKELMGVWDDGARAQGQAAFAAAEAPAEAWPKTRAFLDQYAASWAQAHVRSCAAAMEGGAASSDAVLQMACLSQRLGDLRAASDVIRTADRTVVKRARDVFAQMPTVSSCSGVTAAKTTLWPPADLVLRHKVQTVRDQLSRARTSKWLGKYDVALKEARAAAQSAHDLGYRPAEADALDALGDVQMYMRHDAEAERSLEDAFEVAEAARDDDLVAQSTRHLVQAVGINQSRFDQAHLWARLSEAATERTGDEEDRALLDEVVGELSYSEGKYAEAIAHLQRAEQEFSDVFGPDCWQLAEVQNMLGNILAGQGRREEALAEFDKALVGARKKFDPGDMDLIGYRMNRAGVLAELRRFDEAIPEMRAVAAEFEKALGPDSPTVASALDNLGATLRDSGQYGAAVTECQKALELDRRRLGDDDPSTAQVKSNLGGALELEGKHREAEAILTESMKTLEAKQPRPELLGEVRFFLARAVWNGGGDRKRAVSLAQTALADYRKTDAKNEPREIEAWLAAHAAR